MKKYMEYKVQEVFHYIAKCDIDARPCLAYIKPYSTPVCL